MRALLLAAGFGTRLRPLTDSIPKCLVPINGQPLLDIWLNKLGKAGIGPCLVNTHYLSDQVKEFIENSQFKETVVQVHEPDLLGTAGTLIANADFLSGEDGLLIHADNYCDDDLVGFIQAHKQRPLGCVMTMMTFRTRTPHSCGIVELNEDGVVVGFHEKTASPPGDLANGAVYILSKELIEQIGIHNRTAVEFSTDIIPSLVGKIYSYETSGKFLDIGTPEMYFLANKLMKP